MTFLSGIAYNLKGLKLGLQTPRLLFLGLIRFAVMAIITIVTTIVILIKYQDIMNLLWHRPDSTWILWLWHMGSWLLSLLLIGISAICAFLVTQILFSVFIMDIMSRITEKKATGKEEIPKSMPLIAYFLNLLKQEIPRAVLPVLISITLMIFAWLTPLGPVFTILSPLFAAVFLAWDNTDLTPARRLQSFEQRFRFLRSNLSFHLGFGLLFLIPGVNILFLSFAPVGATLYYVEQIDREKSPSG